MEQTFKEPVSVQKSRKEPGPWDPIRLSGDTGKTPRNPQLPDADNQTSRLPHTLQYEIHSPDDISSIRSAVQLDQSPSSESGHATSTIHSTGHHETQNSSSTVPTTTEASFRNESCRTSKTQDIELSSAESDDCEASIEGYGSVGGVWLRRLLAWLALQRFFHSNQMLGARTLYIQLYVLFWVTCLLLRRVYMRVASLVDPARQDAVPSRAEVS